MVKKYKRVNKSSSIGSTYEADLVNKLSAYCELIGVNRTKLVSSFIAEKLEGKILTNDFIELDKPYYFNMNKLLKEGTVKATTKKPSSDLYNEMIVKKVPNNLDTFEGDIKTYCYDNDSNIHRGIITFLIKEDIKEETEFGRKKKTITINKSVPKVVNLLFDYSIAKDSYITFEKHTLNISLISVNELPVLLDNSNTTLTTITEEINDIYEDISFNMLSNCILWKYNNINVINYFHLEKNPYHIFNILKMVFTSSAVNVDEALDLLHDLVYRTVELYVDCKTLFLKGNSSKDKSISDVFKETVIELDFYVKINKFHSNSSKKVYDVFSDTFEEDNSYYMATYDRLVHYTNSILNANEEPNFYSFIEAFPYDNELFRKYDKIRYYETTG